MNTEFNQDAMLELYETAADKIIAKMRNVTEFPERYKRSWIWELVQNAKDNVASEFYNQKVSIKIEITPTTFQFSHNYGYFTHKNVEGIIRQVNKKDAKNNGNDEIVNKSVIIGKFGTGFMTTHLLSSKIDVKALYKNNSFRKFIEFPIDRTNLDKDYLIKSIDDSFSIAQKNIESATSHSKEEINFSDYNSTFSYPLDENKKEILNTGIADLFHSLPYTLVFVDGIEKVEINNNGIKTSFIRVDQEPLSEKINLVHIVKNVENESENLIFASLTKPIVCKKTNTEAEIRITIPLQYNNDVYSLNSVQEDTPYIFIDFPLIGTENFNFPMRISCPLFEPTEPRDGILLGETEYGLTNKKIFEISLDLITDFIDFAISNKWDNLYNLAKTSLPKIEQALSKDWFKTKIQNPLRSHLLKSEIVQTETNRILLENALFPYATENKKIEKVWHLAKTLHQDKLPKFEHIHEWHKIIDSTWNTDLRYNLEKLVKEIADYESLSKLMQGITLDKQKTLAWLNSVIEFVISENEKLLSDYGILPNQNGDFRKKSEIYFDKDIPNQLKEILDGFKLGDNRFYWSFTNILLDKSIKGFEEYPAKTTKHISDQFDKLINTIISSGQAHKLKRIFFKLVSFSSDAQKNDREQLRSFSHIIFNGEVKDEIEILPNLDDFNFTLANEYILKLIAEELQEFQTIEKLHEQNFDGKDEKQVIAWLDDFISFVVHFEHGKHEKLLNKFAFIPNQNNGFCKRKALKRDDNIPDDLKEIANTTHINKDWNDWLLHKGLKKVDENLFDQNTTQSLKHIADEIDSYLRNYKGEKQESSFSELVFLLEQSETVKNDKEKKFFPNFLNNRDALIVGTVDKGENLKNIATLVSKHSDKLSTLIQIVESDITLEQLEKFQDTIKLVGAENITNLVAQKNKKQMEDRFLTELGNLAERIFKIEFEKEGFSVEKINNGYGSDFKIRRGNFDCLVEIKSLVDRGNNKKIVRMTRRQAEEATSSSSKKYVLCIFPKASVIPTENDFRTKVKFVTNISEKLKDSVIQAQEFERQREISENQEIGLAFEQWKYKYAISESVWEKTGIDLENFIQMTKNNLSL